MFIIYIIAAIAIYLLIIDAGFMIMRAVKGEEKIYQVTLLGSLIRLIFSRCERSFTFNDLPKGDVSNFTAVDETICLNKKGSRTRLTYFSDANNHFWFKVEKILSNGKSIGDPVFEPATMLLQEKAGKYL